MAAGALAWGIVVPHPARRDRKMVKPLEPKIQDPKETQTRLKNLLQSVLAAALGVQSNKNRERDFTEGNPGAFIIAGVLFTAVFVAGVLVVVQLVLNG
jgi:hypothetical protein